MFEGVTIKSHIDTLKHQATFKWGIEIIGVDQIDRTVKCYFCATMTLHRHDISAVKTWPPTCD